MWLGENSSAVRLGDTNTPETCTFNFSAPVTGLFINVIALDCRSFGCEKLALSVNGGHYAFTAADIVTPAPGIPGTPISIDGSGDMLGAATELPGGSGGSARGRVSTAAVSSITFSHQIIRGRSYGTLYQFCVSTPPPLLALTKEADTARFTVGKVASYTLTLKSLNGMPTSDITSITDSIPASLSIGPLPAACRRVGQDVTCDVPAGMVAPSSFVIPVTPLASAVPSVSNTAKASGGGDAACNGMGACMSTATTPVVLPPVITTTKRASANPLVVNAPGQFYTVAVTVANGATTAPITVTDTLPPGITLRGAPTVVNGTTTGVLSGCPSSGSTTTNCSIAAGVAPGTFDIQIPVNVGALAVGATGGTNTVNLGGGGDVACTAATGQACDATTPATRVAPAPHIRAFKFASFNPLIVGKAGQYYSIEITVTNGPTTAPLLLQDMLPKGITLAGPPVVIPGTSTGVLSNCSLPGAAIVNCSVAAGIAPGGFMVRLPVQVDAEAVGPQGGTNTVNLSGGGDPTCTALPNEPECDDSTVAVAVRLGDPKVLIYKDVLGGTGTHIFQFALTGLSVSRDTIAVTLPSPGWGVGSHTITGTIGVPVTITELSPAGWPVNPVRVSCQPRESIAPAPIVGAPGGANPVRAAARAAAASQSLPVVVNGNRLTIPAELMVAGADIECAFLNNPALVVTGRVFGDTGRSGGVPNDGVVNGGEAGLPGVQMRLTNCAAGVLASGVTDGTGHYSLEVPSSMMVNDALCVEEVTPPGYLSTGASVGNTRLPSGSGVNVGGKTYTYKRTAAGAPDHIGFAWDDSRAGELNFGDVALSRFGADSVRSGSPGSSVSHSHTFVAQTGGAVRFGIARAVATPPIDGWSARIYDDPGCTGTLQSGAAVLYPPSVPTTVTAGQNVCVVLQEFIPAHALVGYSDKCTVEASFDFTNASPGLSASYLVNGTTTVSSTALELRKEVRNATKNGDFGLNNEARSGETLEYRITYTNNGATPIGGLTVNDATPVYTSFAGSQADASPATLTGCMKHTPANPLPAPAVACATAQAVGGAGSMNWKFNGQLAPGGTGAVRFKVTVN